MWLGQSFSGWDFWKSKTTNKLSKRAYIVGTFTLCRKWHSGGLGFDSSELVDGDSSGTGSGSLDDGLAKFSQLMDGVDGAGGSGGKGTINVT